MTLLNKDLTDLIIKTFYDVKKRLKPFISWIYPFPTIEIVGYIHLIISLSHYHINQSSFVKTSPKKIEPSFP